MALEEEAVIVNMESIQQNHVSDHPRVLIQEKKQLSLQKYRRNDSLEMESRTISHARHSKVRANYNYVNIVILTFF